MTIIRDARVSDLPFLAQMLAESSFPPNLHPRPTPAEALAHPYAGRYLREWGRAGDVGVIAEDGGGRPLGAAWYRRLIGDDAGTGYIADDIPEVAIAIRADARGRGIGTLMVDALVHTARANGERALSLSVSAQNPVAIRLYQRAGFRFVGGTAGLPVMLLDLGGGPPAREGLAHGQPAD